MDAKRESLQRQAAELQRQGRRLEAIGAYRRLLALDPAHTDAWYELGALLKSTGQLDEALKAYGEALARGVRAPEEVHLNRAVILSDHLRRDAEAETELQAALTANSGFLPAWLNLGNLHEERGRRDEAAACYERMLAAATGDAADAGLRCEALARLVQLRPPADPADARLAKLRAVVADQACSGAFGANACFALGRALDALGQFDEAFTAFSAGNRIARGLGPAYDRATTERRFGELRAAFRATGTAVDPAGDEASAVEPVFICGMYRSGSTLAEQVLAGHPQVIAGGELELLPRIVADSLAPFPASVTALGPLRARRLARRYRDGLLHLLERQPQAARIVTDKRPDNFLLIGLILRLFPNARVVHTVRDPLDTGMSVYFQHLDQRVAGYASDLGDIGHYYGQYRRLMAHWKDLYPGHIFDFDYDSFVREPAAQLRALLGFLGLDWDERCLDFHRRGNTVKTISYWQVRRPLYQESSGRWRHYTTHLGPLRAALKNAGVPIAQDG